MADGEVKIIVGADDSEAQEKLKDTKESFESLGDKQKESQKETEKTTRKFDELAKTIEKQSKELGGLKAEYTQAIINFGKGSTEVKELEGKISSLNSELHKNKETYGKAANEAKKLSSALDENEKSFGVAEVAIGDFISDGVQNLIGSLGDAVQSLFALAEETREFREDMAKLDAAFTTAGHSSETANLAYDTFFKLLGESDRSVEAANHLAELTKNEEEIAKWGTIAAGVTAKFGDSLPIEGLTEAANETAKVAKVTGPFADAINWASSESNVFSEALGGNDAALKAFNDAIAAGLPVEDAFNAALAEMSTEQERSTAITSTLNGLYSEAAAEYNELTASTQAANEATNNMQQAQAELGAAVEPLTTAWTNLKAQGLEAIRPVIEAVAGKFSELMGWLQEHPAVLGAVTGALAALGIALGVVTAAVIAQTVAQWAQNAAWLASPITWIILAIVAVIGALVGAFLYLWNNCDSFREFFTNMWEGIKSAVSTAWEAIKGFFVSAWDAIKAAWSSCVDFFSRLWDGIVSVFSVVGQWFSNIFTEAWEGIKNAWSAVVDFFSGLWDGIVSVFSVVASWFSGVFSSAWNGIVSIWNAVVGFFSGIWNGIVSVFSSVGSWFSGIFSAAWNGIKSVWSGVTSFFSGIWNGIVSVFSNAFQTFLSIGKNIVDGIKQGIQNAWANLKSWFSGLFGDLKSIAKKILGINSPSKVFAEYGGFVISGFALGMQKMANEPIKAMINVFDTLRDYVEKTNKEAVKTVQDYNKELEWEYNDHAWERDRIERETNEKLADREAKFLEDKKKKGANLVKLEEEYNKDIAKINEDYDLAIEKENERHANAVGKIQNDINNIIVDKMETLVDLGDTYKKNVEKIWDDLDKSVSKLQSDYDNQLASRTKSIAESMNLWDEATKNDANKFDLRKNLKSQVDVLKDYNKSIASLEERNIDDDFLNYLKQLGVDSAGEIAALTKMSEKELSEYVGLWQEKNALAAEAATEELEPLKGETERQILEMTLAATEEFQNLHTAFVQESGLLLADLKQSMIDAGQGGYEEIIAQIDNYATAGGSLMEGIAEGIADKTPVVSSAIKSAMAEAMKAAKEEMGIHSPSKVMRDQVGENLGLGMIEGWENKVSDMKKTMAADMSNLTANLRATVMAENSRFATTGAADTGFADLVRAVGVQTAGINSLAGEYRRGSGAMRKIVIELDGRELGHAFVDTGGTETVRIGSKISLGGAKA